MATKKITDLTAVTTPTGADIFPIVQGGVTYKATRAQNASKGADIASAATTDIGAATGEYVEVTGTTTITALGTVAAGTKRTVRFTGALTLTHNATSLILPNSTNITTIANDTATFISLGSGNWICTNYQRADGRSIKQVKGADIASAATTDIGAATGEYVEVTGTTTITALGTVAAGTRRTVRFTGALTLTHNATSLILPSAANITTAADDIATFISLGSGNWRCSGFLRNNGNSVVEAGGVLSFCAQIVQTDGTTFYTNSAVTTTSENDVTIPIPFNCTMKNLYAARSGGSTGTATFTLRKNGADTALTCAISGAATTGNDTTNSVAYIAGDLVAMKVVLSGGATTAVHKSLVELVKTA